MFVNALLTLLRLAVLWTAAARHSIALTRLLWRNARVIARFDRGCAHELGIRPRFPSLRALRISSRCLGQYFKATAELVDRKRSFERKALRIIYKKVDYLSKHAIKYHPLTSGVAVELMGGAVRRCFKLVLNLDMEEPQVVVLARYGSPSLALKDFLSYCGCPREPPAYEMLARHLLLFVESKPERTTHKAGFRRFWKLFREVARVVGTIPSLWSRAGEVIWLASRARRATSEHREWIAFRRDAELRTVRKKAGWRFGAGMLVQRNLYEVLAVEMQLQALMVLIEVDARFNHLAAGDDREFETLRNDLFLDAKANLRRNVDSVLHR